MKHQTVSQNVHIFNPSPPEKVVCHHSERCKDCPHVRHGFICWHSDGTCLRTDIEEINRRGGEHP